MTMPRTDQQRKAIEVYCRELAEALNDAGYEMKAVMEVKDVDIPWTQKSVKEVLWRPIQIAMKDKVSTTEIEKLDVSDIYRVLDRHISSNFGVHIEFPNQE